MHSSCANPDIGISKTCEIEQTLKFFYRQKLLRVGWGYTSTILLCTSVVENTYVDYKVNKIKS